MGDEHADLIVETAEPLTVETIDEAPAEPLTVETIDEAPAEPLTAPPIDEAPADVVTPRDRLKAVGIDRGRTGQFDYIDLSQPYGPDRLIVVEGLTFEHVSEDSDGVWLYRHSQF